MDTWIKYGIGVVLLIIVAYGGFELVSSSVSNLNQKVNDAYTKFGEIQGKIGGLEGTTNKLQERSNSISEALKRIEKKPAMEVGNLLSELEKHPQAEDLIKKVGELSKNVKKLNSKKLTCKAKPSEDFQKFASCEADYYRLAEWCSGDCNADDAKVTLCCKYE